MQPKIRETPTPTFSVNANQKGQDKQITTEPVEQSIFLDDREETNDEKQYFYGNIEEQKKVEPEKPIINA